MSQRGGAAEHEARARDFGVEGFCFKRDVEFTRFRHDSLICSEAEVEMGKLKWERGRGVNNKIQGATICSSVFDPNTICWRTYEVPIFAFLLCCVSACGCPCIFLAGFTTIQVRVLDPHGWLVGEPGGWDSTGPSGVDEFFVDPETTITRSIAVRNLLKVGY